MLTHSEQRTEIARRAAKVFNRDNMYLRFRIVRSGFATNRGPLVDLSPNSVLAVDAHRGSNNQNAQQEAAMPLVRPANLKRLFIGECIISGMFLSFYAAHPVWGADSVQGPSDSSATPGAPTATSPSSSSTPVQGAQEVPRGPKMGKGMNRMQEACGADIKQFCSGVNPGGGRIVECLEAHQKEVSSGCAQLLTKHENRKGKRN